MRKQNLILIGLFALAINAHADVSDDDHFYQIPEGSFVQLRAQQNLKPQTSSVGIGETYRDRDADGVPDAYDWCLATPAGARVWTQAQAKQKECTEDMVGCASAKEETWLKTSGKTPQGIRSNCYILALPSQKDRIFSEKLEMTVIASDDKSVSDEERKKLAKTTFKFADFDLEYQNLILKTHSGNILAVQCIDSIHKLEKGTNGAYYSASGSTFIAASPVGALRKFATVNMAPPVVQTWGN